MIAAKLRSSFRDGVVRPTAGLAPGLAQANLIAVPREWAYDMLLYGQRNPRPCPVLDVTSSWTTPLAPGADLRTDLPLYRVWEDGALVASPSDVTPHWRDDLVAFLIGCSFSFEAALIAAGIEMRHIALGRNVPMYRTNVACRPAGRLHGEMVVSMRPIPAGQVALATTISARFPDVHGAPVHIGDPASLGITDLDSPDFGDAVPVASTEVPVFWACGVTPQVAVMASGVPYAITHAPGHMLITDVPDTRYQV
ncbi:putative hydro-lyase [Actinoplanes sp. NPDC051470]|uniref:putative hydro-lyase n=1 Tax=Actinoplanes sp. NPDC051470 TaxID=3157224 RepID=UPI00341ECD30